MAATFLAARLGQQASSLPRSRKEPRTLKLITLSADASRPGPPLSCSRRNLPYYTARMIREREEEIAGRLHAALDGGLEGYLRTDEASRALWSTDASIYLRKPVGVMVARSEDDVKLALRTARDLGLPVTPRGTGTSLAGQATAPGLALDVSEMNRVVEVDLGRRRCVVEPGVIQGELNAIAEPHGLVFGADTSTSDVATLGGMVGNNSAGMRSLVFGTTADQVISLRCVLPDGETVDLRPIPEARALASFEFDSLAAAARATVDFLQMDPSAVEMLDDVAIGRARQTPAYRDSTRFLQGGPDAEPPKAILLVEWSGTGADLEERFAGIEGVAREVGARSVAPLRTEAEMYQTVRLRKSTLPLLLGTTEKDKPVAFVEDAAVPPERLEEFVVRFEEFVEEAGTWACFYGDTSDPEGVARMRRIGERVADLVVECGGSISGERGDGLSRSEFLGKMYGQEILEAFSEVKELFDPKGTMNPGVIVAPPKMDDQLRIGPGRRRLPVATGLDFSEQGGFAKAVELCNGSGFCRKKTGGTMCPSYMVTLDEQDTTRARANMLRSVLEGTLPPDALTGERMREVMDLCVGCKACKTECPSQVDVASMKTEVLYQSGKKHGFSLRQRAAGHIRAQLALAARVATLFNAVGKTRPAKRAAALVGIDPRRTLPGVTRKPFSKRFPGLPQGDGPVEIALFNDTWNEFQRPEVGSGAVRLFAAAGVRVLLPEVVCCGRPMLSEGLVEQARKNARRNLDLLTPLIERGVPLA